MGKELAKHTNIELCLATGNDAFVVWLWCVGVGVGVLEYVNISVLNFPCVFVCSAFVEKVVCIARLKKLLCARTPILL